jgi:hypothetical protein
VKQVFVKPTPKAPTRTVINVPWELKPEPRRARFKPTKAYADERQKLRKNRKRHSSKAMRTTYKSLVR